MDFLQTVFWTCSLLLAYVYGGYGALLLLVTRLRVARAVELDDAHLPSVTLVISAFNEQDVIAAKIENSLALDYPVSNLEILVVSDCSDDATDQIVASYASRGIQLLRMPSRSGKTAGLNRAVASARGEIIVFSDANSMYNRTALRMLVRNLADPQVGAVTGEQRYEVASGDQAGESENLYWRYEQFIKRMETRLGSVVGGDGAIYAVRRELYEPLRSEDLSDFVNPLQVVAKGWRNVYESLAVAMEAPSKDLEREYRRKVRIVNRAWRGMLRVPATLNPLRVGIFSWQVWSHKLLRWLVPVFLMGVLLSSLTLAFQASIYALALTGQVLFYSLAIAGWLRRRQMDSPAVLSIPYYFCLVNAASLQGIADAMRGKTYTKWTTGRA